MKPVVLFTQLCPRRRGQSPSSAGGLTTPLLFARDSIVVTVHLARTAPLLVEERFGTRGHLIASGLPFASKPRMRVECRPIDDSLVHACFDRAVPVLDADFED